MFRRIVVPLDGSLMAEAALPHAASLARDLDARLVLLRVIECEAEAHRDHPPDPLEWELLRAETRAYLAGIAGRLAAGGVEATTATPEGDAVEEIIHFAQTGPRALLVLCSHGRGGATPWVLGGVAHKAALHGRVSFLMVRAYQPDTGSVGDFRYGRILVPLDGSRRAECVLPVVSCIAGRQGGEVVLAAAVAAIAPHSDLAEADPRRAVLEGLDRDRVSRIRQYLEGVGQRLADDGLSARIQVRSADATDLALRTVAAEEGADLVVLAAHGINCGARVPFGTIPLSFLLYGATSLLVVQDLSPEEIEPSYAECMAREVRGH